MTPADATTATAKPLTAPQGPLQAAVSSVRAELPRVDNKATMLLTLAGVLLGGGLAALAGTRTVSLAVALISSLAAVLVGAAVVLLAGAIRPRVDGGFGFARWAAAPDPQHLLDHFNADSPDAQQLAQAREVLWMSRALLRRYGAIRHAVTLLVAGLFIAAAAAAAALITH